MEPSSSYAASSESKIQLKFFIYEYDNQPEKIKLFLGFGTSFDELKQDLNKFDFKTILFQQMPQSESIQQKYKELNDIYIYGYNNIYVHKSILLEIETNEEFIRYINHNNSKMTEDNETWYIDLMISNFKLTPELISEFNNKEINLPTYIEEINPISSKTRKTDNVLKDTATTTINRNWRKKTDSSVRSIPPPKSKTRTSISKKPTEKIPKSPASPAPVPTGSSSPRISISTQPSMNFSSIDRLIVGIKNKLLEGIKKHVDTSVDNKIPGMIDTLNYLSLNIFQKYKERNLANDELFLTARELFTDQNEYIFVLFNTFNFLHRIEENNFIMMLFRDIEALKDPESSESKSKSEQERLLWILVYSTVFVYLKNLRMKLISYLLEIELKSQTNFILLDEKPEISEQEKLEIKLLRLMIYNEEFSLESDKIQDSWKPHYKILSKIFKKIPK